MKPTERTRTNSSCTDVDSWDIHSAETVSVQSLDACLNMSQENNATVGNSLEHVINNIENNQQPNLNEIQV